jgi:hypothetical protein
VEEQQNLAQRRATQGAALLDKCLPGWEARVDPERLRMSDGYNCILGQCFSDYLAGQRALGISSAQSVDLGFLVPTISCRTGYPELTVAWRAILENRQRERAPRAQAQEEELTLIEA